MIVLAVLFAVIGLITRSIPISLVAVGMAVGILLRGLL